MSGIQKVEVLDVVEVAFVQGVLKLEQLAREKFGGRQWTYGRMSEAVLIGSAMWSAAESTLREVKSELGQSLYEYMVGTCFDTTFEIRVSGIIFDLSRRNLPCVSWPEEPYFTVADNEILYSLSREPIGTIGDYFVTKMVEAMGAMWAITPHGTGDKMLPHLSAWEVASLKRHKQHFDYTLEP
ncbi:hypothetical protein KKH15_02665 [Patescibacteria group bacterium]|nr:hypothetical protein [Patescibacteria group bacterium]MBU1754853.1 hypothetical protein [Patescibacteria group bacterium]